MTPTTPSESARLARIQAQTGVVIAIFLTLHLANTIAGIGGEATYDGVQRIVRYVYQNPVAEILVLLAIVVHIGVGIRRARLRTATTATTPRVRLHRYAAYFLTLAIVGHVGATRLPSVLYDIHVGFRALSFTLDHYPVIFIPYYIVLALAGLYHGMHGVYLALGTLGVRVPVGLRKGPGFNVPVVFLGAALVLGLFSIGGFFFAIHDPLDNDYARLVMSIMGERPDVP